MFFLSHFQPFFISLTPKSSFKMKKKILRSHFYKKILKTAVRNFFSYNGCRRGRGCAHLSSWNIALRWLPPSLLVSLFSGPFSFSVFFFFILLNEEEESFKNSTADLIKDIIGIIIIERTLRHFCTYIFPLMRGPSFLSIFLFLLKINPWVTGFLYFPDFLTLNFIFFIQQCQHKHLLFLLLFLLLFKPLYIRTVKNYAVLKIFLLSFFNNNKEKNNDCLSFNCKNATFANQRFCGIFAFDECRNMASGCSSGTWTTLACIRNGTRRTSNWICYWQAPWNVRSFKLFYCISRTRKHGRKGNYIF